MPPRGQAKKNTRGDRRVSQGPPAAGGPADGGQGRPRSAGDGAAPTSAGGISASSGTAEPPAAGDAGGDTHRRRPRAATWIPLPPHRPAGQCMLAPAPSFAPVKPPLSACRVRPAAASPLPPSLSPRPRQPPGDVPDHRLVHGRVPHPLGRAGGRPAHPLLASASAGHQPLVADQPVPGPQIHDLHRRHRGVLRPRPLRPHHRWPCSPTTSRGVLDHRNAPGAPEFPGHRRLHPGCARRTNHLVLLAVELLATAVFSALLPGGPRARAALAGDTSAWSSGPASSNCSSGVCRSDAGDPVPLAPGPSLRCCLSALAFPLECVARKHGIPGPPRHSAAHSFWGPPVCRWPRPQASLVLPILVGHLLDPSSQAFARVRRCSRSRSWRSGLVVWKPRPGATNHHAGVDRGVSYRPFAGAG